MVSEPAERGMACPPEGPCRQTARSVRDRSEGRSRDEEANLGLVLVGLGASGSSALRAEVFVEVAGWEDEQQTLPGGRGLTARRTVEQRGPKRPVLVAGRLALLLPRRRAAGPNRAPGTRRSGPRAETRALGTGRMHEAILSKSVSRGQAGLPWKGLKMRSPDRRKERHQQSARRPGRATTSGSWQESSCPITRSCPIEKQTQAVIHRG